MSTTEVNNSKTLFGHPRGLAVLFLTEMWERFSYYGMRALLVLYMTKHLIIEAEKGKEILGYETVKAIVKFMSSGIGASELTTQMIASQIYGLYTGFVYFTPFFGGILADRVLGQRKAVYLGGILMAIGHFLMAIESAFLLALLFLVLGNGCFKPNISTQVGSLYPEGDPRRDGAFTIFYMGINLGATFSPLVCGTLGEIYGWHYGFGAAGVGMVIGLLIYHFGRKLLPEDHLTQLKASGASEKIHEPIRADEWKRIFALMFLCIINVVFWSVYEQQGNTMQLWADSKTDRMIGGWEMPATWYQTFNPLMIFIFAPILTRLWKKMGRFQGSSVTKMGIGSALLGLSFVVMTFAAQSVGETEKASLLWLVGMTFVITMGELYLSPIGLSLVTKVAPARMVSMLMGMWFLSSFFGNILSGYIGSYYDLMTKEAFFTMLAGLGLGAGVIFVAANRPLRKVIGAKV